MAVPASRPRLSVHSSLCGRVQRQLVLVRPRDRREREDRLGDAREVVERVDGDGRGEGAFALVRERADGEVFAEPARFVGRKPANTELRAGRDALGYRALDALQPLSHASSPCSPSTTSSACATLSGTKRSRTARSTQARRSFQNPL